MANVVQLLGGVALVAGFALLAPWLGLIVAGALLIGVGVLMEGGR